MDDIKDLAGVVLFMAGMLWFIAANMYAMYKVAQFLGVVQ